MIFEDRWLRWAGMYPSYQMRLMKIGEARFVQKGHGQREGEVPRGVGVLGEPYLHYSFSKGIRDWFEKHRRYAYQEACEALGEFGSSRIDWRGLFAFRSPVRRRRTLKALAFRLPCRPALRFVYMYFLRAGLLDGWPGFRYCRLMARYERMIAENVRQLRREALGPGA